MTKEKMNIYRIPQDGIMTEEEPFLLPPAWPSDGTENDLSADELVRLRESADEENILLPNMYPAPSEEGGDDA